MCVDVCFYWPESTVYVNKALNWASIRPHSIQCLSLLETLMEIRFCCRSSMSLQSLDGRKAKGKSEWGSIVLCSRWFIRTHLPAHTDSLLPYKEINALSFPLCAQTLTVSKGSCDQSPHHVLQLLIPKQTHCNFYNLVLLFTHVELNRNKWCLFDHFPFLSPFFSCLYFLIIEKQYLAHFLQNCKPVLLLSGLHRWTCVTKYRNILFSLDVWIR